MPSGAKTSAGIIPEQVTIEPDVAEQFASTFVPMWQFEDAPFSAGGTLSNEDVRALGAEGSANSEGIEPPASLSTVSEDAAASVQPPIPLPAEPPSQALDAPVSATQEFATTLADPSARPRDHVSGREPRVLIGDDLTKPAAVAASTHGFEVSEVLRSRPSKRLLIGGGVAAILAMTAVAFTRAEAPAQPASLAPTSPSTRVPEGIPLPPSLPLSEMTKAPSAETTTPVAQADPLAGATREAPSPAPPPPRPSADHKPTPAPAPTHRPRNPGPPPGPATRPEQKGDRPPPKQSADVDFGI